MAKINVRKLYNIVKKVVRYDNEVYLHQIAEQLAEAADENDAKKVAKLHLILCE